jgi:hypothetical protein
MVELLSSLWGDWVWLAGAALGIVTTLVAIVYALSGLLMNEKMKTWAKMELVEIFYSAVIISIGLGGVTVMDNVVQGALSVSNSGGVPGMSGGFQCLGTTTSAWVPVRVNGQKEYHCLDICGTEIQADQQSIYNGISSCHIKLGLWYLQETFDESKGFAYDVYISYIKTSIMAEFTINIEYFT